MKKCQWEENVFCSDGAVLIDNNVSEREMKRVVLNRKNSLFVGNSRGGRTPAILASLTSTCRRYGVDPQHYFTQLLLNLPQARRSELPMCVSPLDSCLCRQELSKIWPSRVRYRHNSLFTMWFAD